MGPLGGQVWLGTAAGRVSAGAAVGVLVGLGFSLATALPQRRGLNAAIRRAGCLVVLGLPAAAAACWAGLAAAGLGPLAITVPVAVALLILMALLYVGAVPGGQLRPAWLFGLTVGVAFALLAAMITSRYRIAGTVGLTVLLAAGLLGRQALHSFLSRRGREHSLARLTVPLLVPDLPGYQVQWAYPVGGVLSIGLTAASTPAGLPGGRTPRIQIIIEPVPPGFAPPAVKPDVQPSPAIMAAAGTAPWQPAGPGRWTRRDRNIVQLTERRGNTLIRAFGTSQGGSLAPLINALDSLRPSTPSDLAAISGAAAATSPGD